jgi:hypothetical protein
MQRAYCTFSICGVDGVEEDEEELGGLEALEELEVFVPTDELDELDVIDEPEEVFEEELSNELLEEDEFGELIKELFSFEVGCSLSVLESGGGEERTELPSLQPISGRVKMPIAHKSAAIFNLFFIEIPR